MEKEKLIKFLQKNLKIKIKVENLSYSNDKSITVGLFLNEKLISSDIIYKHEIE